MVVVFGIFVLLFGRSTGIASCSFSVVLEKIDEIRILFGVRRIHCHD